MSDLNRELNNATAKSRSMGSGNSSPADVLRDLLFKLPGGDGGEMSREMDSVERIRAGPSQPGAKRPEDMSPQEIHAVLWQVLTFRDSVVKKIEKTIEKIPGLGPLIEKLMESIQVFIYTTLEPYLKPLMKVATDGLMSASGEVINTHDQYEVFNDPRASDPTHSFLSKDHFNLILNEPAGNLAKIIVAHTVSLVVKAWDDSSMNVHQITEDILQCLFHPDFHNPSSEIQRKMLQFMRDWVQGLGHRQGEVLRRLTKNAVRNHENIRLPGEGAAHPTGAAYNAGQNVQHDIQGYISGIPGLGQAQNLLGKIGNRPPGMGIGREANPGPGFPGAPSGDGYPGASASRPPPVSSYASEPSTGEAASYYGHGQGQGQGQSGYNPPSGGPAFPSMPDFPGANPGGPPPPPHHSRPPAHHQESQHHGGYAPGYISPPPGPPGFPDAGGYAPPSGYGGAPGGYGGAPGGYGGEGYPPPPGPPGGPGFPAADPWGAPPGGPAFPQAYPQPGQGGGYQSYGYNDSRDQRW